MSRIGRKVIVVPTGVDVTVNADNLVTVKGPKGTLATQISPVITVNVAPGEVHVTRPDDEKVSRSLHGLSRTLIHNMQTLTLSLGYSHPVIFKDTDEVSFSCPNDTTVVVSGIDKQKVGQVAAEVRGKRPPEPYKGKGVKYAGEHIRRKAGKAGKK